MVVVSSTIALGVSLGTGSLLAGTALGTTLAAGGFAAFAAGLATNLIMGAALAALTPKPSLAGANRGYQVNSRGSALDHQIIYGRVRVGGAVVYDEATGDNNKYLHRIIAVAGHEIESFDRIYINDEYIDVADIPTTGEDAGNIPLVYSSDGSETSDRYDGKIRINFHLGSPDQAADADLVTESDKWTSAHRLRGIAYMYVRLEFDANVFPNGIPTFTATVKGKKVYNPDTDTTAWSDNPALCIRDYLVSNYGLAELPANIDDSLVNTAASTCDEFVEVPAGKMYVGGYYRIKSQGDTDFTEYGAPNNTTGTFFTATGVPPISSTGVVEVPRYTCNGAFTTSLTPYEAIDNILTSMGGTLWYAQGKWRMKPAYWTTPVLDLNEDDLRSSIGVATRHSRRDNFNVVKGTFRGEESNWQTTDYPQVDNDGEFIVVDNDQESVADVDLPFTDNSVEARRLARITLERNRQQLTITASFGLKTMEVQVGDNIRLTNTRFGWDNKEFEVLAWNFGLTDGLDLQVNMTLRETSESVFDEIDDSIIYERDNTNLPNYATVPAVTGLTLTNAGFLNAGTNGDGTFTPAVEVSWTASVDAFVVLYQVEWKRASDTNYNQTSTSSTSILIDPLEADQEYDFRVRAVSALGVSSAYLGTSIVVEGDETAPSAPVISSATGGYNTITLDWTNPSDKDFKQALIYRNTSNNSASASLVAATDGDTFIDGALPQSTTRYYWVKAEDYSGNISGFSNGVSATTNANPADGQDGQNARGFIMSNPAHTVPAGRSGVVESYAGSGTDIEILDGLSRLTYTTGTPAAGYFTVSSVSSSPANSITIGARSYIVAGVRVADHSNMDVNEDVVSITYTISGRTFSNTSFSFNIVQSITKSSAGADGAGRWNISVTSLPTTSGEAQTAWDAAGIGRDEVESDQAWFYTGTEANPTAQSVWIYDSGTSSWNEQEEVIDGDLLVTGTVTSDKVETNFIDAFTINANNITTGELGADRIRIDGLTLDTETITPPIGDPYQVLIIANEDSPNGAGVDIQQIVTDATFGRATFNYPTLTFRPPDGFENDIMEYSTQTPGLTLTFDADEDFYAELQVTGQVRRPTGATTENVFIGLEGFDGFTKTRVDLYNVDTSVWQSFSMCMFDTIPAGLNRRTEVQATAGDTDGLDFRNVSIILRVFKR